MGKQKYKYESRVLSVNLVDPVLGAVRDDAKQKNMSLSNIINDVLASAYGIKDYCDIDESKKDRQ